MYAGCMQLCIKDLPKVKDLHVPGDLPQLELTSLQPEHKRK